jgi:hypothetical protein
MHTNTDILSKMEADGTLYYIETEINITKELTTCKIPPQLQDLLEQTRTKHPHEKYQRIFHNSKAIYHISAKKVMEWTDNIIAIKSRKMQIVQKED